MVRPRIMNSNNNRQNSKGTRETSRALPSSFSSNLRVSKFGGLHRTNRSSGDRTGAMAVFVCISLVVFLVFAAFTIGVAQIQLSKTELRTAVDAASRAGCWELGESGSPSDAADKAISVASKNKVAGKSFSLTQNDVAVGNASVGPNGRFVFTPGQGPFNSLRVLGKRDDSHGGGIGAVFGGLIGVSSYGIAEVSTSVRADRDISVVIDRSGSMMRLLDKEFEYPCNCDATTPPHPSDSRWAKMLQGYSLFLSVLDTTPSEEKVGLITYGSDSSTDCDLSGDYNISYDSLLWRSNFAIVGMTNLGQGLDDGLFQLFYGNGVRRYSAKTIVLLTDGRPNMGPDPLDEARACKAAGVTVHTITFGDFCDSTTMQSIADITGGTFYPAPDDSKLAEAFADIAKSVPILVVE